MGLATCAVVCLPCTGLTHRIALDTLVPYLDAVVSQAFFSASALKKPRSGPPLITSRTSIGGQRTSKAIIVALDALVTA